MGALAFLCAMPMELRPVVRRLRAAGLDAVTATVGVGTASARRRTAAVLDGSEVDRVVVVGISGAVDERTPIGSLVVPEVVVDGASGREYRPEPLAELGTGGALWTTDALTTGADELAALRARGVVALDMETAAVAEVCERLGVRWSVVRAISDRATDPAVDADLVGLIDGDGRGRPGAVLRYLARRPTRLGTLVRLGRASRRAADAAAAAAVGTALGVAP